MNCNAVMKKLQRAILSTGLVIKISTSQFYSEEQDRMIREMIPWYLSASGMIIAFLLGLMIGTKSDVIKIICQIGIISLSLVVFFVS